MPTYEYVCNKCGKKFELFQKMSDEPIKVCPDAKCKGPVKRLIGEGAGIIFRGAGFYENDYKKKTPPKSEETTKSKETASSK
ncbi:MAG TPA: zinc ribbon domain-containing protein [Verrucomicrobiota bacterium]|nr:zinc ribbon domain-containing protein [Verrucomicrobiota bacterium]